MINGQKLVEKIEVKLINEASTSPEMRFITKQIGNFNGKNIRCWLWIEVSIILH